MNFISIITKFSKHIKKPKESNFAYVSNYNATYHSDSFTTIVTLLANKLHEDLKHGKDQDTYTDV